MPNRALSLIELDRFCRSLAVDAEIDGDGQIANLYCRLSGIWFGIIPLC